MRHIVPFAFQQGVETDYCRSLIGHHAIPPPTRDIQDWPWRIRITCLGVLEIHVDGRPLPLTGKAQHRPLNLLKALTLDRRGCEIEALIDRYWPDLDGDAARNAFDLAVHRLRRLLQMKDAVTLSQGRLLLNRHLVWVDSLALESLADSINTAVTPAQQAQNLLQLYRGPLLKGDTEPALLSARERFRNRFLRHVEQLSDLLQASHDYESLGDFCRRVLELEPLAESVYRRLMHCLVSQGHHGEARQVYQQCTDAIGGQLQASPSPSTRELYARLLGDRH